MYKERFDRVQAVCWKYGLGTEQNVEERENGWTSNEARKETGFYERRLERAGRPVERSLRHPQRRMEKGGTSNGVEREKNETGFYKRMLETAGRPVERSLMHLEQHSLLYCWIHKVRFIFQE